MLVRRVALVLVIVALAGCSAGGSTAPLPTISTNPAADGSHPPYFAVSADGSHPPYSPTAADGSHPPY